MGAALSQSTKRAEAPSLWGGRTGQSGRREQSADSRRDWSVASQSEGEGQPWDPDKMGEVEVSARAYAKMCLHAARHPHAAVNGLLLGLRGPPAECLFLTDCVPLFHSNLALSVMLEVALNQVDLWASRSNLLVAGYYQANAGLDDMSPTPLALKMAGRLAEFSEGAVLIMSHVARLGILPPHLQVPAGG
ncbi:ER membrane protein complex subunit 9 isoform X2 [Mauremys mutica]|uniref:ER membrane protein complex subunit 9 isoform X2 n=1 Tax=Mauremys mutica TaxID=74926 RepID=UPI001D16F96C|nr:ER membrane protein complex subunit 9 isoform X2 [Mauremys mutica]